MIDSVDRIVRTPIRECPPFVQAAFIVEGTAIVQTMWFGIEPLDDDWFLVTDEHGNTMKSRGECIVQWLKPEDKNDPVIQAELLTGLASMGVEL